MMFYKANEIEEELTCSICSSRFKDPRIVPCGYSYCQTCIRSQTNRNSFECPGCGLAHEVVNNQNGFPSNFALAKLATKSCGQVYRNGNVQKLVDLVKTIQGEINDFENVNLK